MTSAAPRVSPADQAVTSSTRTAGPQNERTTPRRRPKGADTARTTRQVSRASGPASRLGPIRAYRTVRNTSRSTAANSPAPTTCSSRPSAPPMPAPRVGHDPYGGHRAGLGEQLDHRPVERRDVLRPAAGHQVPVHHRRLVHTTAPAFRRSVRSDGQDVICRPLASPASMIVHGPWQIDATGLPASKNARTNATAGVSIRSRSGLITPPGKSRASKSSARASSSGHRR